MLALQSPELPRRIDALWFRAEAEAVNVPDVERRWWDRRDGDVLFHLPEIPAEVTVVDLSMLLCDGQQCWDARDGVGLYLEDNHLSVAGVGLVADAILDRLPP